MTLRRLTITLSAFLALAAILALLWARRAKRQMGPRLAPIVIALPEVPDDNGYDVFLKAAAMYVQGANPFTKLGVPTTAAQRQTLADNAAALAEVRRGLEKPCAIPPLADPLTENFAAFPELRNLGQLLVLESHVARENGLPAQALASLLDALRYGNRLAVRGPSAHRGSSRIVQSMALVELQDLIAADGFREDELLHVVQFLANVRAERPSISQLVEVDHQMSLRGVEQWEADPGLFAETLREEGASVGAIQLDGDKVRQMLIEHRNRALDAAQQPFAVLRDIDIEPEEPLLPSPEAVAFAILASIWEGMLRSDVIFECRLRGAQLVVATQLYQLRHGDLPESLPELRSLDVPDLELSITDPLTDEPFFYRTANGDYWLYSAGLDLDDDGGAEMDWQAREGDLVFHQPTADPTGSDHP